MAESLYRKYRPQVFEDVVGQDGIKRTLVNAIGQGKVSHAYLFCGPRGTGKTTMARLLAKGLLCESGPTGSPDGSCRECADIAAGRHPDVFELDAASRTGVENVREEIIGRVSFAPTRGSKKVYIIDEVHMLSTAAFNALLKTLEEPPDHVIFVLCTTDPQKVPPTILSRCQRFDFRRIATEQIRERLARICAAEGAECEDEALQLVAARAEGGMRNALTSLEQLIAFGAGQVTAADARALLGASNEVALAGLMGAVGNRDAAACFRWIADFTASGGDFSQLACDMARRVRNAYVVSLDGGDAWLDVSAAEREELKRELALFGPDRLSRLLGVLGNLQADLRQSADQRLSFEIALTRMIRPDSDLTLEALAERVEALEAGKSAVATYVPAPAPQQPVGQVSASQAPAPQQPARTDSDSRQRAGAGRAAGEGVPAPSRPPAAEPQDAKPVGVSSVSHAAAPDGATGAVPAAEPGSAAGASGSKSLAVLENPAALQRVWHSALSIVKKENGPYSVFFYGSKASFDAQAGCLTVELPAGNKTAASMMARPGIRDCLAAALEQAIGEPVSFRFVQEGRVVASDSGPAVPRSDEGAARQRDVITAQRYDAGTAPRQTAGAALRQDAQPAPRQAAGAAPQPRAAAGRKAAAAPPSAQGSVEDEVPLDAYDDIVRGYGASAPPSDMSGRISQASVPPSDEAGRTRRAPASSGPVSVQAAGSARRVPASSGSASAQRAADADEGTTPAEDLSKMLSGTMGADIVFEEVED